MWFLLQSRYYYIRRIELLLTSCWYCLSHEESPSDKGFGRRLCDRGGYRKEKAFFRLPFFLHVFLVFIPGAGQNWFLPSIHTNKLQLCVFMRRDEVFSSALTQLSPSEKQSENFKLSSLVCGVWQFQGLLHNVELVYSMDVFSRESHACLLLSAVANVALTMVGVLSYWLFHFQREWNWNKPICWNFRSPLEIADLSC